MHDRTLEKNKLEAFAFNQHSQFQNVLFLYLNDLTLESIV